MKLRAHLWSGRRLGQISAPAHEQALGWIHVFSFGVTQLGSCHADHFAGVRHGGVASVCVEQAAARSVGGDRGVRRAGDAWLEGLLRQLEGRVDCCGRAVKAGVVSWHGEEHGDSLEREKVRPELDFERCIRAGESGSKEATKSRVRDRAERRVEAFHGILQQAAEAHHGPAATDVMLWRKGQAGPSLDLGDLALQRDARQQSLPVHAATRDEKVLGVHALLELAFEGPHLGTIVIELGRVRAAVQLKSKQPETRFSGRVEWVWPDQARGAGRLHSLCKVRGGEPRSLESEPHHQAIPMPHLGIEGVLLPAPRRTVLVELLVLVQWSPLEINVSLVLEPRPKLVEALSGAVVVDQPVEIHRRNSADLGKFVARRREELHVVGKGLRSCRVGRFKELADLFDSVRVGRVEIAVSGAVTVAARVGRLR
mmetsp:Transcript_1708/g.5227  ORF Transcript_1708/g.5227 Transcript_1708/m.5227 type:complete len:426 (+) Transcript_1708:307-1584(+)